MLNVVEWTHRTNKIKMIFECIIADYIPPRWSCFEWMKSKHSLIFPVSNLTKWSLPPRIGKLLLLPLESPNRSFNVFFLLSSSDWPSCLEKYTNFIRDPAHMKKQIKFQAHFRLYKFLALLKIKFWYNRPMTSRWIWITVKIQKK
jgi:hypothetical protein